jgi:hypothetical protein
MDIENVLREIVGVIAGHPIVFAIIATIVLGAAVVASILNDSYRSAQEVINETTEEES